MKNKITDLNNHLFLQLERLGDEDLIKDEALLNREIDRGKVMAQIATQIVNSAKVSLDAMRLLRNGNIENSKFVNKLIGSGNEEQ